MLIVLVLRIYKTEKQQFFFIKYNLKSISSVSFSIMKNWFGEGGGGSFCFSSTMDINIPSANSVDET